MTMNGAILPDLIELRRMRKIIGLTQVNLAQRVGISQSMIAKIENDEFTTHYIQLNIITKLKPMK
ncbi:MAG: helix-turn-helix domain-containing protein [Candidatus Ranarchaeia archaeon]